MILLQKIRAFFIAIRPILLSHHPLCEYFTHGHTLRIGKHNFCIGCYIGIPSAIAVMIFGEISGIFHQLSMIQLWIFAFSCCIAALLNFFSRSENIPFKLLSKFLLGSSFAFGTAAIWAIPWHPSIKIMVELLFFQVSMMLVQFVRGVKMNRICNACPYKVDWDHCPGWGPMVQRYKEEMIVKVPLLSMKYFKKSNKK